MRQSISCLAFLLSAAHAPCSQTIPIHYLHGIRSIGHFTVVCSVPWPLNRGQAGGDLVLLKNLPAFHVQIVVQYCYSITAEQYCNNGVAVITFPLHE